jgi:hypothetical protein
MLLILFDDMAEDHDEVSPIQKFFCDENHD